MHRAAAEEVDVEMFDGLAAVCAGVDDGAVAVVQALLGGDLSGSGEQLAEECGGFAAELAGEEQTRDVFAGDDQNVHGRLRVDIREGDDVRVLVEQLRGDGTVDDLAKEAAHMRSFYAMSDPGVRDETSRKL